MIAATAGQPIGAQMTALDGSAFLGTTNVWITGDNGTQVLGSVAAGLCVSEGLGYQSYTTSIVDTTYLKHIAWTFVGAGAVTKTVQVGLPYTLLRGIAGQTIGCQMTATDGSDFTGVVTVYITGDNGVQALGATAAGLCALKGHGYYGYAPAVGDCDFGQVAFTFTGAGAITKTIEIDTLTQAQANALAGATRADARTVLGVIKNAMMGLNLLSPFEAIKPSDANLGLYWLNLLCDDWSLDPQASYAEPFTVFASTGANPETIGPNGTWVLPLRPPAIQGVAVDVGSGQYRTIFVTDDPAWWAARSTVLTGCPSGAYYEASEPDGKLYFSSLLAAATNVRLQLRTAFGRVALTDVLVLPQGYESALVLTLMEAIAEPLHATVSASLATRAGKARALIFSKNLRVPSLSLRGLGLPGVSRGWWDYRTGTWQS